MLRAEKGDKVQLKTPEASGLRGVVIEVCGGGLLVQLEASGKRLNVGQSEVTNFSLAARKAWEKMPDRRVGRPKGSRTSDRVSVTLRINRSLWERFREAERSGVVANRTQTINEWLEEKLGGLSG